MLGLIVLAPSSLQAQPLAVDISGDRSARRTFSPIATIGERSMLMARGIDLSIPAMVTL